VRATLDPAAGIVLEVQERVVWSGLQWVRLGPDGTEVARGGPRDLRKTAPWEPLGAIPLPLGAARALAPLALFDRLAYGLMRHAVGLLVGGWGDRAADVAGWFSPLAGGAWVVPEAHYLLEGPLGPPLAEDFAGGRLSGVRWADGGLAATLEVLGAGRPVRWEGALALGAFAIGAILDPAR
jgi:hypothetical protein